MAKVPATLTLPAPVSGQPLPTATAFVAGSLYPASAALNITGNQLLAPVSGTVLAVDTLTHCVQLKARNGLIVLLRVGINSEVLHSQGCVARVKAGQTVALGDVLLSFNLALLKQQAEPLALLALTNLLQIDGVRISTARQCLAVEDTLLTVTLPQSS